MLWTYMLILYHILPGRLNSTNIKNIKSIVILAKFSVFRQFHSIFKLFRGIWPAICIVKILNIYIILSCTHLYYFFAVCTYHLLGLC